MVLDSWNVGLRLRPFSTESWAAWLRQIIPHFLSLYWTFLPIGKDFSNNQHRKCWMKCCLIHEMLGCIYAHLALEVGLCDWDKSFHISYLYMENNLHPRINQKSKIKRNFWTIFMILPSLSLVKYFSLSFL